VDAEACAVEVRVGVGDDVLLGAGVALLVPALPGGVTVATGV
jgi:hypothetical protein